MKIIGTISSKVNVKGSVTNCKFYVVEKKTNDRLPKGSSNSIKVLIVFSDKRTDIIKNNTEKKPQYKLGCHVIDALDERPIICGMYRQGPQMEKLIEETVNEYLEKGVIRRSKSPWRSSVVMVPKKDGNFRM